MVIFVIIGIVILTVILLFYVSSEQRHSGISGIVQYDLAVAAPTKYTTDGTRTIIYGKYVCNLVDEDIERALPPSITTDDQSPNMAALNYRAIMPPILDQGKAGSCTVNSLVNLLFFLDKNTDSDGSINLGLQQSAQLRSRMYIFYYELTQYGTSYPTLFRALNAYQRYGAPPETAWPYDTDMSPFFTTINDECMAAATCPIKTYDKAFLISLNLKVIPSRTLNYYSVPVSPFNHNIVQNALRNYGPLYIRVIPTSAWSEVTSDGIIHSSDDEKTGGGGHAVILVGYDDIKSLYVFMNSWSADWGDSGYGYIPYSSVEKYIKYALALSLGPTSSTMATVADHIDHPCGSIPQASRHNWVSFQDKRDGVPGCDFVYCTNPDITKCGVSGSPKYGGCGDKDSLSDCYKSDITSPVFDVIDKPCSDVVKTQQRVTGYATTPQGTCYVVYAAPDVADRDVPPAKNLGCVKGDGTKIVSMDCGQATKSESPSPPRSSTVVGSIPHLTPRSNPRSNPRSTPGST